MDLRLFHAARLGDIEELHAVLKDEPTALIMLTLSPIAETPLHVATLTEQAEFVKEITHLRPTLAWEANKDGLIPLHMACATGNMAIVCDLLELGNELCFVKDKGGRTCLHYAAIKGRAVVIRELLFRCPETAKEVTAQGDTALHLAVKHGHFDAFKALVEGLGHDANELLEVQDAAGQTAAQLAAATKQVQVKTSFDINMDTPYLISKISNEWMMRAFLQVERLLSKNNDGGKEEGQTLGHGNESIALNLEEERSNTSKSTPISPAIEEIPGESFFRSLSTGLDRMVPVVAGLITSVTFVAVLSPPQTVWKENMKIDWKCLKRMGFKKYIPFEDMPHPTTSCPPFMFVTFASFNTAGFISAVLIIFLHPNTELAPVLLSSALIFLTLTYVSLTISMSPNILTLLTTYGATVIAFLFVILYVTVLKTVVRLFLRRVILTIRKFRRRSEDVPGRPRHKGILCC